MSDRCSLTIHCRAEVAGALADFLGVDARQFQNEGDGSGFFDIEEADYGLGDARERAAEAGLVFYGTHGAGYDYDGGAFAAFGGTMTETPLDRDSIIVAPVDFSQDGLPYVRSEWMRMLREHREHEKKAYEHVHAPPAKVEVPMRFELDPECAGRAIPARDAFPALTINGEPMHVYALRVFHLRGEIQMAFDPALDDELSHLIEINGAQFQTCKLDGLEGNWIIYAHPCGA